MLIVFNSENPTWLWARLRDTIFHAKLKAQAKDDTFAKMRPMEPALVTADEIPDPHRLELSLTLNGQEMQRTNTGNMIFSIPFVIAYLSAVMTLEPGDVISTGTPAKTELARSLPPFIKPGDTVRIAVEKIGELVNPVEEEA